MARRRAGARAGFAIASLVVVSACRSRAFLPHTGASAGPGVGEINVTRGAGSGVPGGTDPSVEVGAGRPGNDATVGATRSGVTPVAGSHNGAFPLRRDSAPLPGVDVERGRPVLVVVTDENGTARIETGVFTGVDARGVRLLADPGFEKTSRGGGGALGKPGAGAGAGRGTVGKPSPRWPPPAESPSVATFVSLSGNITKGRVIAEDFETVTVVDAACAVVTLAKSRLDPALTVLHGRRTPAAVFPRSLDGALQAAWYDALTRDAGARSRVILPGAVGVIAGTGRNVALKIQPGGPRVEGRLVEAGEQCLLLDLPGVGRRALPLAAIDAASITALPNIPQEEGSALPVTPGWPGTEAFARARSYVSRGPFVAFDKPRAAQGFRLHVSATPASVEAVASVVLPLLVDRGVPHLAFQRPEDYEATRAGAQRGKFITVFPRSDAEAAAVARAIDAALAPLSLPYTPVAGERVVGRSGQVTARYTPFTYEAGGKLVRPDGARENDIRLDDWKPRWARDPF